MWLRTADEHEDDDKEHAEGGGGDEQFVQAGRRQFQTSHQHPAQEETARPHRQLRATWGGTPTWRML